MRINKLQTTELHKNDKRPIARFHRCYLEDVGRGVAPEKCRGINEEQFTAANRIACSWALAFRSGYQASGFIEINEIKNYRPTRMYHPESKVQAVTEYRKVFSLLGKKSGEIIEHFCLLELPLREYELRQIPQWPKGVGSARLREALDELVEIYRRLRKNQKQA